MMPLKRKIYLYALAVPTLVVCLILGISTLVINGIVRQQHEILLDTELKKILHAIAIEQQTLRNAGVSGLPHYQAAAQTAILEMLDSNEVDFSGAVYVYTLQGQPFFSRTAGAYPTIPPPETLGAQGTFALEVEGEPQLGYYHAVPEWGWLLVELLPHHLVYSERNAYLQRVAGLTAVVLGISLLLSFGFSRRLNRNLQRVLAGIQRVEEGHLSSRIEPGGQEQEFVQLQQGINRMIDSLDQAHNRLEQEVEARTRELSAANDQLRLEIDSRIQAEAALKSRERMFRQAFKASEDGILLLDRHGHFFDCNEAAVRILRYPDKRQFLQQKAIWNLSPPLQPGGRSSRDRALEECEQAFSQGFHRLEWTHRTFAGDPVPIEVTLTKTLVGDEECLYVTWKDLSRQKQAEQALARAQGLIQNILDSMPSVLIGIDGEQRVTHWNREATALTGVAADRALGLPLLQVLPLLDQSAPWIQQALDQHRIEQRRHVRETDGARHHYDITVYPLRPVTVEEGAVIRIDDVTDRVRIEEMMVQSEKMLSVGGLAAGMAHEINNPLAGILQNAQVLQNRFSADLPQNRRVAEECGIGMEGLGCYLKQRGLLPMVEAILDSGRRAARIVQNMLSFSRKGSARMLPHSLAELIDQTIELASNDYDLKKRYDFRKIAIERHYEELPPVICEANQIQQVLLNLLKNAAQALSGPQRPKTPGIRLRLYPSGSWARFEVEDNGPGMDDPVRKRIFEPFFTTKEVGVGTGLGLSVSYFIITENHRGRMSVQSAPGQGTCFRVELPLEETDDTS